MSKTLDYRLRYALPKLNGGKLAVLIALVCRANLRSRCWPTVKTLCEDTGLATATVSEALRWLKEHEAIRVIPYDERSGPIEKGLPVRQHVYELTGYLRDDETGRVYPYLYASDAAQEEFGRAEISVDLAKTENTENSEIEISPIEISIGETKDIKRDSINNGISDPNKDKKALSRVLQSKTRDEGETEISVSAEDNTSSAHGDTGKKRRGRPRNPLYTAVAQAWGIDAPGWVGSVAAMLAGKGRKNTAWYTCRFDPPAAPEEVAEYAAWWKNRFAGKGDMQLPRTPEKIQMTFYEFRQQRDRSQSARWKPVDMRQQEALEEARRQEVERINEQLRKVYWGNQAVGT